MRTTVDQQLRFQWIGGKPAHQNGGKVTPKIRGSFAPSFNGTISDPDLFPAEKPRIKRPGSWTNHGQSRPKRRQHNANPQVRPM